MFVTAISLILANTIAVAEAPEMTSGPIKMKPSEIRAYNAQLSPTHPNYIRCKRTLNTGSLVKKSSLCRTNQEWTRVEDRINDEAREVVEGYNKGFTRGN